MSKARRVLAEAAAMTTPSEAIKAGRYYIGVARTARGRGCNVYPFRSHNHMQAFYRWAAGVMRQRAMELQWPKEAR